MQSNHQQPIYGAPGAGAPVLPASAQTGAPGNVTYSNDPSYVNTTGAQHHGHHQASINNVDGHNHNESTIGKIKDHLKGNHSHDPASGGGFGAGYTGNDHGHTNQHPVAHPLPGNPTHDPMYGAPANVSDKPFGEKPSLGEKIKHAVSGDATYQNDPAYNSNVNTTGAHHHHQQQHGTGLNDTTHQYGATNPHTASHNTLGASNTTTQPQYGAAGATPVVAQDAHHHDHHNKHHADGTTKPSMGDKISGTMDTIVGKMTHNDAKVAQGEVKKTLGKDAAEAGVANAQAHETRY